MSWQYPPEFLESLAAFGLAPRETSRPAFVREALADLYRYELRRLRDRQRTGVIQKSDYHEAVVAVRKRYWLLTLSEQAWEAICRSADERADRPPMR